MFSSRFLRSSRMVQPKTEGVRVWPVTVEEPQTLAAPSSRQAERPKSCCKTSSGLTRILAVWCMAWQSLSLGARVGLDVVFEVGAQGCGEQCSFSLQAAVSPNSV